MQKSRAALQIAHPRERSVFKALLLTSPNSFGNLGESPFKPVLPISGKFVARDTYLGSYSLGVEPNVNPVGVGAPG